MNPLVDLMNRPTTPAPQGIAALLGPPEVPTVRYSYAYAWVVVAAAECWAATPRVPTVPVYTRICNWRDGGQPQSEKV